VPGKAENGVKKGGGGKVDARLVQSGWAVVFAEFLEGGSGVVLAEKHAAQPPSPLPLPEMVRGVGCIAL